VVAALGVEGEGADDFAGVVVDDADVEVVDEEDDAGSVEGSAESDVVELTVVAEADASVADAFVAVAQVRLVAGGGCGFGSCLIGDGGGGAVE
jgi:hypothetical protein